MSGCGYCQDCRYWDHSPFYAPMGYCLRQDEPSPKKRATILGGVKGCPTGVPEGLAPALLTGANFACNDFQPREVTP